jgi:FkbM family methyltransferase
MRIAMSKIRKSLKAIAKQYPYAASIYRAIRYGPIIIPPPAMTPMGFKFSGSEAVANGVYEPDETRLVKKLLPDIDCTINIGANIGYYACIALNANVPVIAFEPIELNVQYLLNNIASNKFEAKAEIFPIALSDCPGVLNIYGGGSGASLIKGWAGTADDFSCLVPSTTLDRVLGNRFNHEQLLIIVDIEGAENRMLDASILMLDMNPRPLWLVEINGTVNQPKGVGMNPYLLETFEKFWSRGYKSVMAGEKLRNIDKAEISRSAETGIDIGGSHNFLFYDEKLQSKIEKLF